LTGRCQALRQITDISESSAGAHWPISGYPIGYAAGAHAMAACENFLAMEWHQPQPTWHKDITDKGDLVVQGHIPVPTGPGLGIKVNEEAMRPLCRQGEFFTDPTTYWDSQVGGEKAYT
jgi:L-alanine-DL-glutamate epimerase-like enolase superfamily enzyme